jgi:uncharacterized protein involved in high-affinity Fe2+ transport
MSDKYQLSSPSVFFEADIKSLPDKGFGVSSWPGYTTTVILYSVYYAVKKSGSARKQGFELILAPKDIPQ